MTDTTFVHVLADTCVVRMIPIYGWCLSLSTYLEKFSLAGKQTSVDGGVGQGCTTIDVGACLQS